jgi:hypothetical protein
MSESHEKLYSNRLGITDPWEVASIKRDSKSKEVTAIVALKSGTQLACPICGLPSK